MNEFCWLKLFQVVTLKVESESGRLFSTLIGQPSSSCAHSSQEDVIEVNGLFAAKQGFKNGQVVGSASNLCSYFSSQLL